MVLDHKQESSIKNGRKSGATLLRFLFLSAINSLGNGWLHSYWFIWLVY